MTANGESAKPVRVLIVDDQPLMREGLRLMLQLHPSIEVVGEAAEGREAIDCALQCRPDVVLMDIRMPGMDGVQATRVLTNTQPAPRVIMLTTFDDDAYLFPALRAGALGYLLKDVDSTKLVEAICAAKRGESILQPAVAARVVAAFQGDPAARTTIGLAQPDESLTAGLSTRELEVIRHLASGKNNREIAQCVHLSEGTIKNYVSKILSKLDVRDRTQAAIKARELGLVPRQATATADGDEPPG